MNKFPAHRKRKISAATRKSPLFRIDKNCGNLGETEMIMDFSVFTEARAGVEKIRWPENLTI